MKRMSYAIVNNRGMSSTPGLRAGLAASLLLEGLRFSRAPLPAALRPPDPALPRRPLLLLLKLAPEMRGVMREPPPPIQEALPDVIDPPCDPMSWPAAKRCFSGGEEGCQRAYETGEDDRRGARDLLGVLLLSLTQKHFRCRMYCIKYCRVPPESDSSAACGTLMPLAKALLGIRQEHPFPQEALLEFH